MNDSPATIMSLIAFFILAAVYLSVMIPYCCSLRKTMRYVPEDKRVFPNILIWFFLIPWVGFIFEWMLIPFGIPSGLKKTLPDNADAARDASTIKGLGLAMQILSSCSFLFTFLSSVAFKHNQFLSDPFSSLSLGISFSLLIPTFILWIVYWVKIVKFRKIYFENKIESPQLLVQGEITASGNISKRPVFLTVWLAIQTMGALIGFFSYVTGGGAVITHTYQNAPTWTSSFFIIVSIINIFATVLLWMWKKIGFYILIAVGIVICVFNLIVMGVTPGIVGIIVLPISIGILYLAMKPVWSNFK